MNRVRQEAGNMNMGRLKTFAAAAAGRLFLGGGAGSGAPGGEGGTGGLRPDGGL